MSGGLAPPQVPEDDSIALQLHDERGAVTTTLDTFREYSFNSHFLTPTDAFHFVIGDEVISKSILDGIYIGQTVTLSINGLVQAGGFIDRLSIQSSRHGGTEVTITGRDWLSPAVDSNIDPHKTKFTQAMSLRDVIVAVFAQFGFDDDTHIVTSNAANRNVMTGKLPSQPGQNRITDAVRAAMATYFAVAPNSVGPTSPRQLGYVVLNAGGGSVTGVAQLLNAFPSNGSADALAAQVNSLLAQQDAATSNAADTQNGSGSLRGTPTTKKGKPLKSFLIHQLKPYPHEGAFAYASRISQRFGLWIWPSADGQTLIVSQPTFDQEPIFNIVHKIDPSASLAGKASRNNVLSSTVDVHGGDQPTIIIATGFGGGGENVRTGMKIAMVNELVGLDATTGAARPEVEQVLLDNPDATILPYRKDLGVVRMPQSKHKPVFLHDDESKTPEELANFVQREMALKQRDGVVAHYEFEGHSLAGVPWCVDAIANVDDDVSGLHNRMWVISRTFEKSRSGGTKTKVELILPNTLEF